MSLAHLAAAAAKDTASDLEVHERGGPHPNTVAKLRRFHTAPSAPWTVRKATLNAYNIGFGWPAGRAHELYVRLDEPPPLRVDNVEEFAELVARRVLNALAAAAQFVASA